MINSVLRKIYRCPALLKLKCWILSFMGSRTICVNYWSPGNAKLLDTRIPQYNWGDFVNEILASLISGKRTYPYEYTPLSRRNVVSNYVVLGSIVPWALHKNSIVWGAGCHWKTESWNHVSEKPIVKAVRGPLTRELFIKHGIDCPKVYGDPALLFPRYYKSHSAKIHKYGIVYHFLMKQEVEKIRTRVEHELGDVIWINPNEFGDWREFIDALNSCKYVLSSSLHGLIIADAYDIPNVWIRLGDEEKEHKYFKYHDYFLSVGKDYDCPVLLSEIGSEHIQGLIDAWQKPIIDLDKLLNACPFKND